MSNYAEKPLIRQINWWTWARSEDGLWLDEREPLPEVERVYEAAMNAYFAQPWSHHDVSCIGCGSEGHVDNEFCPSYTDWVREQSWLQGRRYQL